MTTRLLTVGALVVAGALAIAGCRKKEETVPAPPRAIPRANAVVAAQQPFTAPIACEQGMRFAVREGGKTVGVGIVTAILD